MSITPDTQDEFYSSLKEKLQTSQPWPGPYLFKFIVKTTSPNLSLLKALFDGKKAKFTEKKSSKKTFVSIGVYLIMNHPEEVILIYKKVSALEGIIVL